jgi:hypothetical protein
MVSTPAQLSLFNITAVIKPAYEVGDRIRVKKKPIAASYVKRGDFVEIAGIHPIDSSIKFWNERSERWEFIYPDEISSIVKSTADSVTPVEVAVTESIASEPAVDSVTPAEVVVTESIAPEPAVDSVTPAEVVVTESDSPHSDLYNTPPIEAVTESDSPHSDNDSVTPVDVAVTESLTPESNYFSAVSPYKPRGTARGKEYYRLSYKCGGKVRHVHIRGGNTDSPIAQAKVREVRSLLAAGIPPAEIAAMLKVKN